MALLDAFLRQNNVPGIQHGSNHQIWWVPVKLFNQLPIEKWEFNRDPDMDRVAEIHDHILRAKRADGIIHLADVKNKIVCYESNHRREALKGIEDCADILIDVMWNTNDEELKEEFRRLNKAVSVSELYIAEKPVDFAELIAARDSFCKKYAMLKSTSPNSHRPAFEQNSLLDDFARITKENKISVAEMMKRLEALNTEMATRDRKKLKESVIEKCTKSGCWLFAWERRLNAKELA
jgi:hypothetical protein